MSNEELILERIDYENKEHLLFLKEIMKSSGMDYLWNISDNELIINKNKDKFIVLNNEKEKIGYINISDITDAYFGKTVSIYYAIIETKRKQNYGIKLVGQISKNLLSLRMVDCIVAQVDIKNVASQKLLLKSGYNKVYEDDSDIKFIKLNKDA